jgi:hexokinase
MASSQILKSSSPILEAFNQIQKVLKARWRKDSDYSSKASTLNLMLNFSYQIKAMNQGL